MNAPSPPRTTGRLAFPALITGNLILAIGPWMVRLADVGPVASGFWRVALAIPFLALFAWRPHRRRRAPAAPVRAGARPEGNAGRLDSAPHPLLRQPGAGAGPARLRGRLSLAGGGRPRPPRPAGGGSGDRQPRLRRAAEPGGLG